ncbi:MAG: SGNH/GDSL hydrolase family protein [Methylococcaceae bacterium]|nr:SGNH/GDSL hydrolase family protein [Methylococcaceae bacterium]
MTFTACENPDRYLFWDDVHPTERGHALIAGEFYATAIPEPSIITLMGIAVLIGFGQLSWRHKVNYSALFSFEAFK